MLTESEILKQLIELGKGKHGFFDLFIQGKWNTINLLLDDIRRYDSFISMTHDLIVKFENKGIGEDVSDFTTRLDKLKEHAQNVKKEKIHLIEILSKSPD